MLNGPFAIALFIAYAAALVGAARWGARAPARLDRPIPRAAVYVLGTGVFYGAWLFCGALGIASRRGLDFLPFLVGPVLVFAFGRSVIVKAIRVARAQGLSSLSDLVAARYGKSAGVAATVTAVTTVAAVLMLMLQIRVVSGSLAVFFDNTGGVASLAYGRLAWLSALVAIILAGATMTIGVRQPESAVPPRGLLVAVAADSLVRLTTLAAVGLFVVWGMFGGLGRLTETVARTPAIDVIVNNAIDPGLWLVALVTTMGTALLQPGLFEVTILGNRGESDVGQAAWWLPLYAIVLGLLVMPLAVAGLAGLPQEMSARGLVALVLPLRAQNATFTALALVGHFSLVTSAAILTAASVAPMIVNDLVLPLLLRGGERTRNWSMPIATMRRAAVAALFVVSLAFAWIAVRVTSFSLGTLALATIAQIAPATIGGLFWQRGTARGAIGASLAGLAVAAYTLFLPAIAPHSAIVTDGPLGFDALQPTALFALTIDPFAQGMVWSLTINVLLYIGVSLSRPATVNERLQAGLFLGSGSAAPTVPLRSRYAPPSVADVEACLTRYMGAAVVRRRLTEWHAARDLTFESAREADATLLQFAEELVGAAVGAASARKVVALLLQDRAISAAAARQIIDDAAFEIQNSRDMLQHAIDVARDGMAVYDAELRLIAWNRAYRDMFQLPADLMRVGMPLDVLVRSNAERGIYGPGAVDQIVGPRVEALLEPTEGSRLYSAPFGRVLEMRSIRLNNGGLFFTYTDATAQATSEEELEAENLTLEGRVRERTEELERLNVELIRAKAEAEDANVSKSRFLAAASHDLLQPLSAARLYTTSLRERLRKLALGDATSMLALNIDLSLEAVEDILGALLEISHLDAGATKTDVKAFTAGELLRQLQLEFEPIARERGLDLRVVASNLRVSSDRKLLRRMLQNLISNAIKYTYEGRVLVGVRGRADQVRFFIYDTGIGIPDSKRKVIFREFERLPSGAEASPGAGLGLSIVERLSAVLNHPIELHSIVDKGTVFVLTVPRAEAAASSDAANLLAPTARQRSLDGMTVAAIDNESHILSAIKLLLQGWDCRVASGTGLYEVERSLDSLGVVPDVVVADYHIGETDGLEVIAALRTRFGPLPAVLVTADRSPVVRDLATAADVRVLHKPLKPAALRALLSQWHLVRAPAD